MEKNWIEKIKEAVRVAMNKGVYIDFYSMGQSPRYALYIDREFRFTIYPDAIFIHTKNGNANIPHKLTDREDLEIQSLGLSVKEYKQDMAIMEFNDFICGEEAKIITVDNLDDDEQ